MFNRVKVKETKCFISTVLKCWCLKFEIARRRSSCKQYIADGDCGAQRHEITKMRHRLRYGVRSKYLQSGNAAIYMHVAWSIKRSQSKLELIAPHQSFEMELAMRCRYRGIGIYWVQTATVRDRSRLASDFTWPRMVVPFGFTIRSLYRRQDPFYIASDSLFVFAAHRIASSHATAA